MSNYRKGRKARGCYLNRVGRIVLTCILVAVAIWPMGIQPQATQAAPAYAPQTPTLSASPTPTPTPLADEGAVARVPHTPPSPDNHRLEPEFTANTPEILANEIKPLSTAVQVLSGDGNYFLKVDLDDPRVHVRTMLANNDAGGYQYLSGMKSRLAGQGYAEWAIVNADLFSPTGCPYGVNCGQGLTYIEGQHKPNWSAYGETWRVRGNIGFDSSNNLQISVGDSQTKRYMTVAGGPRVLMGGGSPACYGELHTVELLHNNNGICRTR